MLRGMQHQVQQQPGIVTSKDYTLNAAANPNASPRTDLQIYREGTCR
jgi:hypothetical protein